MTILLIILVLLLATIIRMVANYQTGLICLTSLIYQTKDLTALNKTMGLSYNKERWHKSQNKIKVLMLKHKLMKKRYKAKK